MYELIIHFFPSDPLSENISCLPESVLISPFLDSLSVSLSHYYI